jgi:acyl carrier protein
MVAEIAEVSPDEVTDTASFGDELGLDSLRAMELMVAVDKKYKIKIPEKEFAQIRNVDDAVAAVQRQLARA